MSYWIEIHCNSDGRNHDSNCYSFNNANPAALGETVTGAAGQARKIAKERGWTNKHNEGWRCPNCKRKVP